MPPLPPPRDRYLTRDEAHKLIEAADAPHVRLFIILALSTAARHAALLDLTWDRVDFDHGKIDLGKAVGNKGRATVPITSSARFALVQAKEGAMTRHVIEYAGRPVLSIKKGFANAVRRAGLKDVTPHVLRHTAAVWMAEIGRPMAEIAQYLGHESEKVTYRVYARYSPNHLQQAATALELDIGPKQVQKNLGAHPKAS